jgi:hypothetical protein
MTNPTRHGPRPAHAQKETPPAGTGGGKKFINGQYLTAIAATRIMPRCALAILRAGGTLADLQAALPMVCAAIAEVAR